MKGKKKKEEQTPETQIELEEITVYRIIKRKELPKTIKEFCFENPPFGWLKFFIKTKDELKHISSELGENFKPTINLIFQPFDLCPPEMLRVVFITDTEITEYIPPFFRYFNTKFNIYELTKQGVLFLKTGLTYNRDGIQTNLWNGFMYNLISYINTINSKTVYISIGEESYNLLSKLLSQNNIYFALTDPGSRSDSNYRNLRLPFDKSDILKKINSKLDEPLVFENDEK